MSRMCLMALVVVFVYGWCPAFAQPPGYSNDEEGRSPQATGNVAIAMAWGEQLKPPSRYSQGIINLKEAMMRWAGTPVTVEKQFKIGSADLTKLSVVFITTDQQFQLTDTEKKKLRDYVAAGGFLVVDNAAANIPNSQAGASLLRMVKDIAGSKRLEPIPNSHVIYQSPFKLGGPPQGSDTAMTKVGEKIGADGTVYDTKVRSDEANTLQGIFISGRLAILYSDKGYTAKWNDILNDAQLKFGVNLITYAVSQKR